MQVLVKCRGPCEWASKIASCEIQCADIALLFTLWWWYIIWSDISLCTCCWPHLHRMPQLRIEHFSMDVKGASEQLYSGSAIAYRLTGICIVMPHVDCWEWTWQQTAHWCTLEPVQNWRWWDTCISNIFGQVLITHVQPHMQWVCSYKEEGKVLPPSWSLELSYLGSCILVTSASSYLSRSTCKPQESVHPVLKPCHTW